MSEGRVEDPMEILLETEHPTGSASICLHDIDAFVILVLYCQEPSTAIQRYVNGLYYHTRTLVYRQTVANFFDHSLESRAFCVTQT